MKVLLDKQRFGPWALVTGASSGIGKEFARRIGAAGINLVLVARREALLQEVGRSIAADFKVDYRALAMDLSQEGFIERLTRDTNDLDIGLVVSNEGALPGKPLKYLGSWVCTPRPNSNIFLCCSDLLVLRGDTRRQSPVCAGANRFE